MWNNDYNSGYPGSGQYNPSYLPPPGPPPSDSGGYDGEGYGYAPPPGPPRPQQYRGYGDTPWGQNAPPRPPAEQQHYGPMIEGPDYSQKQPYFQYSQCTGRKKALCIGINYFGQDSELGGCINDAHNMKRFICQQYGYQLDDVVMLTDDSRDPIRIPTKQNMITAMQWLVRDAQPNDSLFFHYSGHGGSVEDTNGDEADGYDEVIYPVDFQESGHIVDDDLHDILVKPLPAGCRLTAIFDSCHSATALDLPYVYSTEGKIKEPNLMAEAGEGLLSAVSSYARGDTGGMFQSAMGIFKTVTGAGESKEANEYTKATKTSPADVISWSGCKDSQTSADTQEAGRATGAMSYAFVTVLTQNPNQSYMQLLNSIRHILANEYSQKPQLSSSHPMDTDLLFIA